MYFPLYKHMGVASGLACHQDQVSEDSGQWLDKSTAEEVVFNSECKGNLSDCL